MLVNHVYTELQRRIQAMEMRCYRTILHISCKDHVTNEEVRAKIQQAIGPHEDILTIEKRRKLQRYGHVSRSSGLAKTILQGTVKGERRKIFETHRFTEVLNLHYDPDLENNNPVFTQDTPAYADVPSN